MFTVIFAIGRHARLDRPLERAARRPGTRIARPRQIYTGPVNRHYVPIDQRLTPPAARIGQVGIPRILMADVSQKLISVKHARRES